MWVSGVPSGKKLVTDAHWLQLMVQAMIPVKPDYSEQASRGRFVDVSEPSSALERAAPWLGIPHQGAQPVSRMAQFQYPR